jgi:hypothetical protein
MQGYKLHFQQFPEEWNRIKDSGGNLLAYLKLIYKYANYAVSSRKWRGEALFQPQLDQAILALARHPELLELNNPSTSGTSDTYVVLVTEVYVTGGHGRVMNRIAEQLPTHIVFTDLFGNITSGAIKLTQMVSRRSLSSTVIIGEDILYKLKSILALLDAIKPKGVILLGHHQDVTVPLAGSIYSGGQRTIYIHHCDHEPALGALIRFPVHVDTIEEIKSICCDHGHSPRLWPMTVPPPSSVKRSQSNLSRIATCGSPIKFEGQIHGISYKDIVRIALSSSEAVTLMHVGPLSESFVREVRESLANAGVAPARFVHVGPVSDLRQFLLENDVDLYLQSFPAAGGLTAVEVQSIGIPAVYANPDAWSARLIGSRSVYASRDLEWSNLEDIPRIINRTLETENWPHLSQVATQKYRVSFHPDEASEFFRSLETFPA